MAFISYAQNLEDVILWRALRHVQAGFYIDVGAWDPRDDSVTLAFYERGWRGINVEPDPVKFAGLQEARPRDINLQLALADVTGERPFYSFPETGWSTLDPAIARQHREAGASLVEYYVRVSRLVDVCDLYAPAEIHFLKIDVEGSEAKVLAGADFTRYRPWIITIEATSPNSQKENYSIWEGAIVDAGYRLAHFDGLNRYYVALEKVSALLPELAKPANVFDDFVSVAAVRKALAFHGGLQPIHELNQETSRVRAREEARHQEVLAAAEARVRAAESHALDVELSLRLAQADVKMLHASKTANPSISGRSVTPSRVATLSGSSGAQNVYLYDASLILHFGFNSPVGIVRVEQYLAEQLAQQAPFTLRFVLFDRVIGVYRALRPSEQTLLNDILFHRYCLGTVPAGSGSSDDHEMVEMRADTEAQPPCRRGLLGKVLTTSRISDAMFREILSRDLLQRLPVNSHDSPIYRAAVRILRRTLFEVARAGRLILSCLGAPIHVWSRAATHLSRVDIQPAEPGKPAQSPQGVAATPSIPASDCQDDVPDSYHFAPGDVLITIGNTWDYMDYAYLTRIIRQDGVRLVSVIYDVICIEMPHTSPSAMHVYHRHWVELGHLASHLVAISRYSLESYRRLICEPNDLAPRMSHAYLPNFLYDRREEIGEKIVPELLGRRFVVYCSTIETRKNHQLMLHLWDRLRQEIDCDVLPVLVFVGSWGWGTEAVRLISERNWRLRKHLRILNNISDAELIWLYRNARFTVFPSLAEGFGLAVAESLSFGTPAVTADCPALIEASEGLMPAYDPLDLPSWLEEMRRLILHDDYLLSLREKATGYKGRGYEGFALAIRDAILAAGGTTADCSDDGIEAFA